MYKLSAESLDFALVHVVTHGDTDVLPTPFEFDAIRQSWSKVRTHLTSIDLDTYQAGPSLRCLTPKGLNGFRVVTQLDPYDTLVLTALVYALHQGIESSRERPSAVMSYRLKPDLDTGRLYDSDLTFETFVVRASEIAAKYRWVTVTDIADFFPRIYTHRLENMLDMAGDDDWSGGTPDEARVLKKLLKAFNQNVSRGIPVGPAATRSLADLAITSIDRALQLENIPYVRYADDFRLFANSEREAYRQLAFLAEQLDLTHGLTLQQSKTHVLTSESYLGRYGVRTEAAGSVQATTDIASIREIFGANMYEDITPTELTPDEEASLRDIELYETLKILCSDPSHEHVDEVRLILNAITSLRLPDDDDVLIYGAEQYPTLFRYFVRAWGQQAKNDFRRFDKLKAGSRQLLNLLRTSNFGHLPYHRAWVLDQLFQTPYFASSGEIAAVVAGNSDELTSRYMALTMWAKSEYAWFQRRKPDFHSMQPWVRRAFLVGTTCLPGDEGDHFRRAVAGSLTPLEKVVVDWAVTDAAKQWSRSRAEATDPPGGE